MLRYLRAVPYNAHTFANVARYETTFHIIFMYAGKIHMAKYSSAPMYVCILKFIHCVY